MRAVIIEEQSLNVHERPDPLPREGHVVVATHCAGINAADLLQRRGVYPSPPGWPSDIPGMELSGLVTAVGAGVEATLIGRRVCAIVGAGAQSTRAVVPVAHLIDVPDTVGLEEAGGFAEAFVTAYDALVIQGRLDTGQRVLISGASGGVGCAAVQIARLLGAHVSAVTRNRAHDRALIELGANEVISLEDVAGIAPVDVVLELVGAAHLSLALNRVANFARIVVIGVAGGGSHVDVNLLNVMRTRSSLTGSTLRSRDHDEKADVIARVRSALQSPWEHGEITMPVAASFPLDDVETAYRFFAEPGKFGKVLLTMPEETT